MKDYKELANSIAEMETVTILMGHGDPTLYCPELSKSINTCIDKNTAILEEFVRADLENFKRSLVDGEDDDALAIFDALMDASLTNIMPYVEMAVASSVLYGVSAAQSGAVPYGTVMLSHPDAMDISERYLGEGPDDSVAAFAERVKADDKSVLIRTLARSIADDLGDEELSMEDVIATGILYYIATVEASRAARRRDQERISVYELTVEEIMEMMGKLGLELGA